MQNSRTGIWNKLISAILVTAIIVLGVLLASDARQAMSLESDLTKLRTEAGHLDIVDGSKVYAVRIQTPQPNEWAWRIYLPGNHTYMMYNYRGRMPELALPGSGDGLKQTQHGSGSYGPIQSGEFVLRFRVEQAPNGQWSTKVISRTRGFGSVSATARGTWLADRDWIESSAIPAGEQRDFAADATFDLIRLRQESAVDPNDPARRAETVALWITGASVPGH